MFLASILNMFASRPEAERRALIQQSPLLFDTVLQTKTLEALPPQAAATLRELLDHLKAWR